MRIHFKISRKKENIPKSWSHKSNLFSKASNTKFGVMTKDNAAQRDRDRHGNDSWMGLWQSNCENSSPIRWGDLFIYWIILSIFFLIVEYSFDAWNWLHLILHRHNHLLFFYLYRCKQRKLKWISFRIND